MFTIGGTLPPAVMKVAVTFVFAESVRVQVSEVPVQPPPLKPLKAEPDAGVAVKVIVVPVFRVALQAVPQLIPPVLLVTVPDPVPALTTVRVAVVVSGFTV